MSSAVDASVILTVDETGIPCPKCQGSGINPNTSSTWPHCPICCGHGRVAPCLANRVARIQAGLPVPEWPSPCEC